MSKFKPGDRIVIARHSAARGDFAISREDYGKHGVVVVYGQKVTRDGPYISVLLDDSIRNQNRYEDGNRFTWKTTEDQLDLEEGPW